MRLISWNVNGIRAILKRDFLKDFNALKPDILCLQETKASPDQLQDVDWPKGYFHFWNAGEKKGYSGTAIFTQYEPIQVVHGMGMADHDREGRVLTAEYADFYLVNVYTPNAQDELRRLDYRVNEWDPTFRKFLRQLKRRKPVIFCGDLNVAHQEIDLANPKSNTRNAGFTIEERESFTKLLDCGFIDTFREFEKGPRHYSWWSYRCGARERNVGWRIDYFGISQSLRPRLKHAFIRPEILGSDHCPVGIEFD